MQVLQRKVTAGFSMSTTYRTWHDISSFNINITPSSTASRILVFVSVSLASSNVADHLAVRGIRDSSSIIGNHTSLSGRSPAFTGHHTTANEHNLAVYSGGTVLDHPNSTSAVNYKVQGYGGGETFYMNRPKTDNANDLHYSRGVSTLTLMEVTGNTQ